MISQIQLEARFARIDTVIDTIADCESFLDEFFQTSQDSIPPSSAFVSPKGSHKSETEIAHSVAVRIKRERDARGWRQQDLSEITGIARPNIARLESGRRMPKISTLQKIADALGLRIEELID